MNGIEKSKIKSTTILALGYRDKKRLSFEN